MLSNGILEVHWLFTVTDQMPDMGQFDGQEVVGGVGFRTNCLDDSGSAGYSPALLQSDGQLLANRSYGLGYLKVRDNDGELTRDDVPDQGWVSAGEQLHFTGAMWFMDTEDAPLDSAFDVRVARNNYVEATARDTSNNNGSFFISIDVPNLDIPEGITYEVQTYNEKDPTHVMASNSDWSRTFRVDGTAPMRTLIAPAEEAYEAASTQQAIRALVSDEVGVPMELTLNYWVEQDHDLNRNGEADPSNTPPNRCTTTRKPTRSGSPPPSTTAATPTWGASLTSGAVGTKRATRCTTKRPDWTMKFCKFRASTASTTTTRPSGRGRTPPRFSRVSSGLVTTTTHRCTPA